MEIKKHKDVEILIEFKRRFKNSVLSDCEINSVLDNIGMEEIRKYLKERNKRIVKYEYAENKQN